MKHKTNKSTNTERRRQDHTSREKLREGHRKGLEPSPEGNKRIKNPRSS